MGKVIASYPSVKREKASKNIPTNLSNAILHPKVQGQIVIMSGMCSTQTGTSGSMLEQQGLKY